MEAKTRTVLIGVGMGILAYMIVNKRSKSIIEVKSKADGKDDLANTDAFSYMDGEFYNADGDFYGADGNFYDADGTFIGNDGEFEGVGQDENDTMSFASGKKPKKQRNIKVGKSKRASKGRSLAITKKKLSTLKASKKKVASKNNNPQAISEIDKKIKFANRSIAKYTGYLG